MHEELGVHIVAESASRLGDLHAGLSPTGCIVVTKRGRPHHRAVRKPIAARRCRPVESPSLPKPGVHARRQGRASSVGCHSTSELHDITRRSTTWLPP
nr:hypothetical protein [Micromonospora sp. U21]